VQLRLETTDKIVYEQSVHGSYIYQTLFGMPLNDYLRGQEAGEAIVGLTTAWHTVQFPDLFPDHTAVQSALKKLIYASIDWPDATWRANE